MEGGSLFAAAMLLRMLLRPPELLLVDATLFLDGG